MGIRRVAMAGALAFACGCSQQVGGGDGSAAAGQKEALTWTGTDDGDDSCVGGSLVLLLDRADESGWVGTSYYESSDMDGQRYRATYRVEGALEDGTVRLRESDILESDRLPETSRWCKGEFTYSREASGLVGSYVSDGCGCTTKVSLGPQ